MFLISGPRPADAPSRARRAADSAAAEPTRAQATRAEAAKPSSRAESPKVEPSATTAAKTGASPASEGAMVERSRPYAPLVAQLIATSLGLDQTRRRRRASPTEAAKAYRRSLTTPGASLFAKA